MDKQKEKSYFLLLTDVLPFSRFLYFPRDPPMKLKNREIMYSELCSEVTTLFFYVPGREISKVSVIWYGEYTALCILGLNAMAVQRKWTGVSEKHNTTPPLSLISILILLSHLILCLPTVLFSRVFSNKILYAETNYIIQLCTKCSRVVW
jgi:hypothetical protein